MIEIAFLGLDTAIDKHLIDGVSFIFPLTRKQEYNNIYLYFYYETFELTHLLSIVIEY